MLERLPKLNPPLEDLIEVPPAGTVTSVSSGAGAVVPIEWLREINTNGVRPGELTPLINDLEDQAEEEDMVSAWPDDTGVPNTIKILPGNPAHGPRIKVALRVLRIALRMAVIGPGFCLARRRDCSNLRDPAAQAARCLPPSFCVSFSNSSN
jgi:hypothetical protein